MIEQKLKESIMIEPVHCRCGGEAEIFHIAPEGYEGSYCVRCTECLIQTPFFNKDKDKAIEVWNRVMDERTAKVETYTDDQQETWSVCECGTDVRKGYNYCPKCGAKLDWSEK